MSTLNKFIIYKCGVCGREAEILIDPKRPDPVRCNITYKCRGKLQRVGESSTKKFLFTPPVAGLQDYVPRGNPRSAQATITEEKSVSLFSAGGSGMLSIAALTRNVINAQQHQFSILDSAGNLYCVTNVENNTVALPSDVVITLLLFTISPSLLQFKKYTYNVSGSVQVIQGPDDTPSANTLKFTNTPYQQLRVFINGVELSSTQYDRSVENKITLTPAIFDTNNVVEAVVYNDLSQIINQTTFVNLEFKVLDPMVSADLAYLHVDAWGNYGAVDVSSGDRRYMLHCTDLSALVPDTSYGVAGITVTALGNTKDVLPSEIYMLLARPPHAHKDKELYAYVSGADLLNTTTALTFSQNQATGEYELTITETKLTSLVHPMVPSVAANAALFTGESTDGTSTKIPDNLKRKYIIGPT